MNEHPSDRVHPEDEAISLAAANWLVKRDQGFTAEEQDEFSAWLAASSRHGDWLARHQKTWKACNLLGDWRPAHSTVPNPDLLARPRQGVRWLVPVALAAACLAVGLLVLSNPAKPGPTAVATAPLLSLSSPEGYAKHTLADGTALELNRGALVMVHYTPGQRHVRLVQGEAFFTVAPNAARPFFVQAGDVRVRAVGTAFNVRIDTSRIEVLVTEGKVQVGPVDSSAQQPSVPLLVAGQLALVPLTPAASPAITTIGPEESLRLLAWQPRMLEFDSTPLQEVVATFNRHNTIQLVLADAQLAGLPIVASIRSDNLDGFVRLLELSASIRAERRGPAEIALHATGARSATAESR